MAASTFSTVRTRMAPSPTGEYHVGHIATLLKNYAFAHKHAGQFVLRVEDTDQERKVEGAVEAILAVIKAYGLNWDEGPDVGGPYAPYVQSERLDLYKKYAQQLVGEEKAYYCFCSKERLSEVRESQVDQKQQPRYDQHCRALTSQTVKDRLTAGESAVIRLAVPEDQSVKFSDMIRGEITIQSNEVDDQVLLKSDGFPTYHLAVVVDDHLMKISHVMRGEEWISSTPKQVLLYSAFEWEVPIFVHIPVFLNPDGKGKMSKRKGTVSAQSFLDAGYLPEALLNFFMILGWSPPNENEILSLEDYIQAFDPKEMSAKSVVFDLNKLNWINGMYIRKMSFDELRQKITPFVPSDVPQEKIAMMLELVFERLEKLSDFETLTQFWYRDVEYDEVNLLKKSSSEEVIQQLETVMDTLQNEENWDDQTIETQLRSLQEENDWKKSQFFMLIRMAVSGKKATPPLFEMIAVFEKAVLLERLNLAKSYVQALSSTPE